MFRTLAITTLVVAVMLSSPAETKAQNQNVGLVGMYQVEPTGAMAYVYRSGRAFLFIDEAGARAYFAYTSPGRLVPIAGDAVPMVVTVHQGVGRRLTLRFDSNTSTGYWVKVG